MSLIEYQAEPLETKEAMLKRYAAARKRLWDTGPAPKPVAIEPPPARAESIPLVQSTEQTAIDDDEYAAVLARIYRPVNPMSRWQRILKTVGQHYQFTTIDIKGGTRSAKLVRARHVIMFMAVKGLGFSYPKVGRLIDRDHTTVLHGVHKMQAEINRDPLFAQQISDLMSSCGLPPL